MTLRQEGAAHGETIWDLNPAVIIVSYSNSSEGYLPFFYIPGASDPTSRFISSQIELLERDIFQANAQDRNLRKHEIAVLRGEKFEPLILMASGDEIVAYNKGNQSDIPAKDLRWLRFAHSDLDVARIWNEGSPLISRLRNAAEILDADRFNAAQWAEFLSNIDDENEEIFELLGRMRTFLLPSAAQS